MSPCVTLLLNLHDRMTTVTKPLHNYVASDDDEPDDAYCHPFVIMDNMRLTFGCPSVFADETLVWDNKMHAGRADNAKIIAKLTDFLHSHCAGDSLSVRQAKLADMWHAQYNTNACIYIARFTDAVGPTGAHSLLKKEAVAALVDANIPFVPWDIWQDFLHRLGEEEEHDVAPVDWEPDYDAFLAKFPFNRDNLGKKVGSSVRSGKSQSATRDAVANWQSALNDAKSPSLSPEEKELFHDSSRSAAERQLRDKILSKHDAALPSVPANGKSNKRTRQDKLSDDEEPDQPLQSGNISLLAHEKFMRAMRLTIERSEYINFASMSKDRLDQLHVLGVGSANSKRLSSSTMLVTSATEADVKILTYDYEAISSGFLYTYITLLSESSFDNAMARVKDRLAWWQWLTSFFADNKPAAVKFIHWFMLAHHAEILWLPVTMTLCVLLAIKAKEECHVPTVVKQPHVKIPRDVKKVRPGPGTLTVSGGVTFTPSQTAKLVQWRGRFPGFCASRLTREYTCSKEKRGLPCKFKHECAWCHSTSCKATCAQAEKL
jgi:hypothetical protein